MESIYQPEQRTDEWYQHRHGLITASSIWKVFGSKSIQNQLIYEKCGPIDVKKYNKVNTESPLHWGQKYEQLSKDLYEMLNSTKIQEFGCIKHPNPEYYFIGASPDGINVCPSSHLYGRMLEIKNVVSRNYRHSKRRLLDSNANSNGSVSFTRMRFFRNQIFRV